MGEPIGMTSGILALAGFAFTSSVALCKFIREFKNSTKDVRELRKELEALGKAIESLQELASKNEHRFEPLRLPLLHCDKACTELKKKIAKCSKHSHEPGTSVRDWAKLKYEDSEIVGFKNTIASYKATISIVVADVNLRTTMVTENAVQELKRMHEDTEDDLRDQLKSLNEALKKLSDPDNRRDSLREEIDSMKQCLALCEQTSKRAEEKKTNEFEDVSADQGAYQVIVSTLDELISAKRVTAGVDATQWLGRMSDDSVQALAKSRGVDLNKVHEMTEGVKTKGGESTKFEDRYGCGYQLARK